MTTTTPIDMCILITTTASIDIYTHSYYYLYRYTSAKRKVARSWLRALDGRPGSLKHDTYLPTRGTPEVYSQGA